MNWIDASERTMKTMCNPTIGGHWAMNKRNPLQHSKTPRCDALMRNRLNSNDLMAWRSLAESLERSLTNAEERITKLEDEILYGCDD